MATDKLEFRLEDDGRRYRALLGGEEVGFSEVDPIGADALLIKHTEVRRAYEGRGFGIELVRHMLEDARGRQRRVIPVCPFVATYIRKHPELLDYVQPSYREVLTRP